MNIRVVGAVMAAYLAPVPFRGQTPAPSQVPAPAAPSSATPAAGSRAPSSRPTPNSPPEAESRTERPAAERRPTAERPSRRTVYITGKVVMEDGSTPPESVRIDLVCAGKITKLGFTDSGGGFSTTSNIDQISDASSPSIISGSASPLGQSIHEYTNCSVRAFLAGYRSTEIKLHLAGGGPKTLILHPATKVEGVTVSATSLTAPKSAQKALEKALKAMRKHQWDDARPELERAVAAYPEYAAAWSELGNVHLEQGKREQAREAFRRAVSIDPRFTSPYFGLAELALKEQNWAEMAQATATLIKLDPYFLPAAYAYDAMAQLNLSHLEAAERSAREGIKMDTSGEVPKLHHVLGVVLMRKRDYPAAADELRAYLATLKDGPEAQFVRRQLDACETR